MAKKSFDVHISDSGNMAVETKTGALFNLAKKTRSTPIPEEIPDEIIPWGNNNIKPKELRDLVESTDILPAAFDHKKKAFYGGGLMYGKVFYENGIERFEGMIHPEVEAWLNDNDIDAYLREATNDRFMYANFFPEYSLSSSGKYIGELHCQDAYTCRTGKVNPKTGMIEKIHLSYKWDEGGDADALKVDCVDHYYRPLKQIEKIKPGKSFIIPSTSRINGRVGYEKPLYEALLKLDWVELSKLIPQIKRKRLENQMSLSFHIEIDESWWEWKYPGFSKKKAEDKTKIQQAEIELFLDTVTGVDAAGKVLMTTTRMNLNKGDKYHLWEITPLKKNTITDDMLEDSKESDFHLVRAIGVHPSLVGISPGKGRDAGSGAVERVGFNNEVLTMKYEQDIILFPLNKIIAPINGFTKLVKDNEKFCFMLKNFFIQTLNTGSQVSDDNKPAS